jgi:hypothetical protein
LLAAKVAHVAVAAAHNDQAHDHHDDYVRRESRSEPAGC